MKKNSWDIKKVNRVANVIAVIMFAMWLQSCGSSRSMRQKNNLVDTKTTAKTHYLFNRIKEIPKKGYAFGHQDATAYGIN